MPILGRISVFSIRKSSKPMVHIAAGTQALNRQQWEESLEHFEQALLLNLADAQTLGGKMVAAVGTQDTELSWRAIRDVVAGGVEDELARRLRARVLIDRGCFQEALDDLERLNEETPKDLDLIRDRGLVIYKLGRLQEALRDSETALKLNPKDILAMNNHGAALLDLGRPAEAVEYLEAAIELAPEFERPRELLAKAQACKA